MRFASLFRRASAHLLAVLLSVSVVSAQSASPPLDASYVRAQALLNQLDKILAKLEEDIEGTETKMLLQPDNAVSRGVFDGMTQRQSQLLAQRASLVDLLAEMKEMQGDDDED